MCKCTPEKKTPFCGLPGCEMPPESEAAKLERAKAAAHRALDAASKAWYEYAGLCEVGPERIRAFDVYENVHNARRL